MRSAGTRSGVNWIRLNSPPIDAASVLMAIVLARPGTPSTRRWPRARRATASRSSNTSWPTMTFLTSYSTRYMGRLVGFGCWSTCPPVRSSVLGQSRGATGHVDGHGQADPDEDVLAGRVDEGGDDADHAARAVEQGTAGVAGIDRRVDLDEVMEDRAVRRFLERPAEPRDDAGAHRGVQPERVADDEGLAADPDRARVAEGGRDQRVRQRLRLQDRDVVLGMAAQDRARRGRSVGEGQLDRGRLGDDVEAGQDVAGVIDDDARPEAAARRVRRGRLSVVVIGLDE